VLTLSAFFMVEMMIDTKHQGEGTMSGGPVNGDRQTRQAIEGLGGITHGDRLAEGKLIEARAQAKREGWSEWIRSAADEHAVLNGCRFDLRAALHVIWYFETKLKHTSGRWAGKPFIPMDWQGDDIMMPIFGWMNRHGLRRFQTAYIEVPKKSGKSELCSGFSIYGVDDQGIGEPGARVYNAATSRDQARIVYDAAELMLKMSPDLQTRLQEHTSVKTITNNRFASKYVALDAEHGTKEGLNPSLIIVDEVHIHKSRKLWDTLKYGNVVREEPLTVAITTAGVYDQTSLCWELHEKAQLVIKGGIFDDRFFGYIRAADKERGDRDPSYYETREAWYEANPSLGVLFTEENFEADLKDAKLRNSTWHPFLRYRLNIWTDQTIGWLPMDRWDACDKPVIPDELKGRKCWGGLDLSTKLDLSAFVLVFPREREVSDEDGFPITDSGMTDRDEGQDPDTADGYGIQVDDGDDGERHEVLCDYDILCWFWAPLENAKERQEKDRVPYIEWAKRGFIELTPGDVIDYNRIERRIKQAAESYDIQEIVYDRAFATQLAVSLENEGTATMVDMTQNMTNLSGPSKDLETLVRRGGIAHGGHPVLRWNAANVKVKVDWNERIRPVKEDPTKRIDGIVATIMALARAVLYESEDSVYNDEEILAF